MRYILGICLLLILAGCNPAYHELAHTSMSDPVWQLNVGKWAFNENDLTKPAPEKP